MYKILYDAALTKEDTNELCSKVANECDLCERNGHPIPKKKISFSHMNKAFNASIQAGFLVAFIRNTKYIIRNIICT